MKVAEFLSRKVAELTPSTTYERNQLIKFEGEVINLPQHLTWEIHRQVTSEGLRKMSIFSFSDFDEAHHIMQAGHYHLFRLKRAEADIITYCVIAKK
jgi:hypothetical protein